MKEEKTRESDDEFEPDDGQSTDDEETIAQEEKLNQGDSTVKLGEKDEIDALKRESEMPLDELLDDLPPEYLESLRNPSARLKESDEVTIIMPFFVSDLELRAYHTMAPSSVHLVFEISHK